MCPICVINPTQGHQIRFLALADHIAREHDHGDSGINPKVGQCPNRSIDWLISFRKNSSTMKTKVYLYTSLRRDYFSKKKIAGRDWHKHSPEPISIPNDVFSRDKQHSEEASEVNLGECEHPSSSYDQVIHTEHYLGRPPDHSVFHSIQWTRMERSSSRKIRCLASITIHHFLIHSLSHRFSSPHPLPNKNGPTLCNNRRCS